jgi:6-pyruvoyl-tetrahydropterin synthase
LHGHTYDVEIALRPAFGSVMNNWKTCPTMIMDLAACRSMAKQSYGDLDHANLNDFLDEPTVEELCWKIYRDLEKHGFEVRYIRIMETDRGGVYYETERKRVE